MHKRQFLRGGSEITRCTSYVHSAYKIRWCVPRSKLDVVLFGIALFERLETNVPLFSQLSHKNTNETKHKATKQELLQPFKENLLNKKQR